MRNSKVMPMLLGILIGALLFGTVSFAADLIVSPTTAKVLVDGKEAPVEAYNINGSNYFKLRDFAAAVDVGVWWDGENDTVHVETDKGYDPNYTGTPGSIVTPKTGLLKEDTTYHNGYLGITFTLPKGWYVNDLEEKNFTASADLSDTLAKLEVDTAFGYVGVDLMEFSNLEDERMSAHVEIDMFADRDDTLKTLAAYMKDYEAYMLEEDDDYDAYLLDKSSTVQIAGKTFEMRRYTVRPDDDPYKHVTLTCALKDGFFYTVELTYWPENTKAESELIALLTNNLKLS